MRRFGDEVIREPVLLRLPAGRSPPQGAILDLIGEIRLPRGPSDGFDERTWLRRHGVHVVVRASRWRVVGHRGGLAGFADGLRARLARSMAPGLEGERRAVIAGIVLGEDEGLSEDLRAQFRASGLYHLLAVSGQNVALIVGGVLMLAYWIGLSRMVGEVVALAAIAGYVLAVGWQPSVVRAGVAGALASLAWLAARPRDRWYFLLLGAAVLLAWNPYSLLDAGFQLSFAAVAAIFVVVPRLQRSFAGYPVPRSLADVVAVSAACGVATAPILLTQFGSVPLYSIPANALAAPVVAPLLGIALVTALVAPAVPPLAVATGLDQRVARCVPGRLRAARRRAAARRGLGPGGAHHGRRRARLRRARRATASAARASRRGAGAARGARRRRLAAPTPARRISRRRQGLRITFLDVGQGDAALLQAPGGAVLVDEGPPEADVAEQLSKLGVKGLSLVVLTHPQRDHVGGAARVLERFPVGAGARSGGAERERRRAKRARRRPATSREGRRRPRRAGLSDRATATADPLA